jgi:hypothetical protein
MAEDVHAEMGHDHLRVLIARSNELLSSIGSDIQNCRERGLYPRWTQMSLTHGQELAQLVRDLATHLRDNPCP